MELDLLDRAVVARFPALVKAYTPDSDGRRIVSVKSSTEEIDLDGDCVLQKALLDAADNFVRYGHFDIEHRSDLGHRMIPPIPNPASWIVGRPLEVTAAPGGRTFVKGEISRSLDGVPGHADELWDSLRREPPVAWYASIYGFPMDLDDCTKGACPDSPATRFIIKAIEWTGLAFTRTPKNTALKSAARIVTAKAYLVDLAKAEPHGPPLSSLLAVPQTMDDVYAAADCLGCQPQDLHGYRNHFENCRGFPPGISDMMAHAMMHRRNMEKATGRTFQRTPDGVLQ